MPVRPLHLVPFVLVVIATLCAGASDATSIPIDYNRDIRPILSENCFYCHGQDANRRKGKLRLDTQSGQRTKDIVVPGKPDASALISRIFTHDPDDQMPPPDSHRAITEAQRNLFRRWIVEGAVFEGHWAFQAPVRPPTPTVSEPAWSHNPIDRFVLARLEASGLTHSAEAPRETLIRRVSLDLVGLPPTPQEVDAFIADQSPDAYERLVDRLLASPHYGERMALPWLDAARYADSNGFQQDGDTFQWIWRDWVVKALNDDMPFDRFTIEQLAGDLIPQPTTESRIASGFNRNHPLNGEGGAIAEEQRHVILFDRVDVTATNWLGLTMACAQCHDHKYDPITNRDYYSFMAAFNNLNESGVPQGSPTRIRVAEPLLEVASTEQKAKLTELEGALSVARTHATTAQQEWELRAAGDADEGYVDDAGILALLRECADPSDQERIKKLKAYFESHVSQHLPGNPSAALASADKSVASYKSEHIPRVMVMADNQPRQTYMLERGNYEIRKDPVTCNTPSFLPPLPADAPHNRLGIARWLMSADQPLTARVIINRAWQMFFGVGLVKTSEDFGLQGEAPIHRALLDWLAVDFRESGWSMKRINRMIVTSATYRQSSRISPLLAERDPENRLYARGARFRLSSMLIRDQALSASGLLNPRLGGQPVYPYQPGDIWGSLAITKERDFTYPTSSGEDLYRRSLYTFWRRTVAPANMFDASTRNTCRVRLTPTSTPLHALTTLNDPTFVEAGRLLAEHVLQDAGAKPSDRLTMAFRRVLARNPDAVESRILLACLDKQRARFQADGPSSQRYLSIGASHCTLAFDQLELAAYAAVCLTILNLDEALTKE